MASGYRFRDGTTSNINMNDDRVTAEQLIWKIARHADHKHHGQRRILRALCEHNGPMTISQLCEATGIKAPSMSEMVSKLERRGFVLMRSDPEDKRKTNIDLSEEGKRKLHEPPHKPRPPKVALDNLTDDEVKVLISLLKKVEPLHKPK